MAGLFHKATLCTQLSSPANTMTTPINWTPTDAQLRQFGFFAIAGFGMIGTVLYFRFSLAVAYGIWSLAILCPILSLIWPRANQPIYWIMSAIGLFVGTIISTLLLGTLFLLVFTSLALVFRLMKRDTLQLTIDRDCTSYWLDRPQPRQVADYFRQF